MASNQATSDERELREATRIRRERDLALTPAQRLVKLDALCRRAAELAKARQSGA